MNTSSSPTSTQQRSQWEDSLVSLVDLKTFALKVLPNTSPLRNLILTQPDQMRRSLALAKADVFAELLYSELDR